MTHKKLTMLGIDTLTHEQIKQKLLAWLYYGPVLSFGSRYEIGKALRALRKAGLIRYVKSGGESGWELTDPGAQPSGSVSGGGSL
jgi:aryl-alcohol dehydrogenase-like predicted oxidoreductase